MVEENGVTCSSGVISCPHPPPTPSAGSLSERSMLSAQPQNMHRCYLSDLPINIQR